MAPGLKRQVPAVSGPDLSHSGVYAKFFFKCCKHIGYLMMKSQQAKTPLTPKGRGNNSLISLWKYILILNTYPVMAGIKDFLRNHHLIGNQINA